MSDTAIRVENLGKRYRIGKAEVRPNGRRSLRRTVAAPFRYLSSTLREPSADEIFWALKDVSFEVKRGEVVGIIGRNGAGKSTLLKILSRITEPTKGYADIYGRVGSLLEVGTGFHPELTGRENIYLSGTILGMKKWEIDRKLDEIVAFAEIEKFLDTPVKRYSSGMYVRLAFAVAAHLEPEILLVDEVLAVGDAAFQKKCLGKMGDVAKEGRTVLLVSHNMNAITELCHLVLWVDQGALVGAGSTHDVVNEYTSTFKGISEGEFLKETVKGDGRVKFNSYRVTNQFHQIHPLPITNEDILIHVKLRVMESIHHPACGISVWNDRGVLLTSINTVEQGVVLEPLSAGEVEITIRLAQVAFLPGDYTASAWIMNPQGHIYALADKAISFEIGQAPLYGNSNVDHRWGCVYTKVEFAVESPES